MFDADPKAIQQINFTWNLDQTELWYWHNIKFFIKCDCNFNYETNFQHELFLADTQASRICKGFVNGSSANIEFLKSVLPKMV